MNQSKCILVAVANKSLRARCKSSDWHEQKHLHTGREKWNTKRSVEWSTSAFRGRETKWLSYAWEDHVLNVNLCVKFVIPLIFTEIYRKGLRFFNKSDGVSLMYRRSVYAAMELWKVPQQGHFIFVIFINFTIGSVPITAVRWQSSGKFVLGFPDILFVANNISRYKNTMVCACKFFGWEGRFYVCPLFVKHMAPMICCAFHGYHKVHNGHKDPASLWHALSSRLKQGACS